MQWEPQAKESLEQPQCNGSSEATPSPGPVLPCPVLSLVPEHPRELPWITGGAGAVRFWGCLRSARVPSLAACDDPASEQGKGSSWICWQGRSRPGVSQSPPLPRGGLQAGNLELMAVLGTSPGSGQQHLKQSPTKVLLLWRLQPFLWLKSQVLNPGPGRKRKEERVCKGFILRLWLCSL